MREALKASRHSGRKIAATHTEVEKSSRSRRNDVLPVLKIETCSVDALKSHARKLRKSDVTHVRDIANSISTLGFNVPLLIGKNNVVLDGESRLAAAKLLGLASVPCIRVDHLNETEQRLLRMAVNRLGEKGSWDAAELKAEFEELIIADAPIEITGFGFDEIDQIVIGRDEDPSEINDQSETAVLAPQSGASAVARLGDLFLLGPHRVICGNATDPGLVNHLMRTEVARMVFTDAPFDVVFEGPVTVHDNRDGIKVDADKSDEDFSKFNQNWMKAVFPHLVDGGLLGSFIDWRGLPMAHAAATALGLTALDLVVWATAGNGTPGLYRSEHRLLPLFKKGDADHVNNIASGKRGRSNMWTYPASPGLDARQGRQNLATTKPASMLEDTLTDLTNRGEIVLDPFLGSGSTLIAAQNTGRVCCGVERDPLSVDVIVRRYEASTGVAAILADSGETFEQVAARRHDDKPDSVVTWRPDRERPS
jgi:DNA modification methylase